MHTSELSCAARGGAPNGAAMGKKASSSAITHLFMILRAGTGAAVSKFTAHRTALAGIPAALSANACTAGLFAVAFTGGRNGLAHRAADTGFLPARMAITIAIGLQGTIAEITTRPIYLAYRATGTGEIPAYFAGAYAGVSTAIEARTYAD